MGGFLSFSLLCVLGELHWAGDVRDKNVCTGPGQACMYGYRGHYDMNIFKFLSARPFQDEDYSLASHYIVVGWTLGELATCNRKGEMKSAKAHEVKITFDPNQTDKKSIVNYTRDNNTGRLNCLSNCCDQTP